MDRPLTGTPRGRPAFRPARVQVALAMPREGRHLAELIGDLLAMSRAAGHRVHLAR